MQFKKQGTKNILLSNISSNLPKNILEKLDLKILCEVDISLNYPPLNYPPTNTRFAHFHASVPCLIK